MPLESKTPRIVAALEWLASMPYPLWTPAECPLCAQGVPLVDLGRPLEGS